jgi:DNA polymerase-4
MSRVIAHIDLNAFFVRAEELKDPSLEGKAVAVGGVGRAGIISTCSYKAREAGVHSGMPTFEALELCPNLILLDGHYLYYEALSNEFIAYIRAFTPLVEQTSIDECFADFTEQTKSITDVIKYFEDIQKGLFKKTGLKCSIGVSTTKFLAKMGSDIKKPMGLTIIHKKDIGKILFNNPVGSYFGIGVKSVPKLNAIGIKTIGDLYYGLKDPNSKVSAFYGKYSQSLIDHLEGKSSDIVQQHFDQQDSISTRNTLPNDVDTFESLQPFLIRAFNTVFERFKPLKLYTGGITISYRYTNLKTKTCAKKLKNPTDDKVVLQENLLTQFKETYHNESVRQIGVVLTNLIKKEDVTIQMSLFDYEYYGEKNKTQDLILELNRYLPESSKLFMASELLKRKKDGDK